MIRIRNFLTLLFLLLLVALNNNNNGADAFCNCIFSTKLQACSSSSSPLSPQLSTTRQKTTRMFLVSEEDVLEAVEHAETLWAVALESRKIANTSSDRAEKKAEASAEQSEEAANIFQNRTTPVSKEQLIQVDTASKNSLDATFFVNKALEASDEADRLEEEAEKALRNSEERLDQHLKDFPNSPLA
mmetsp:Transcript_21531/g.21861  ORF Transcript_21531/g.21861 Transcript_21531/m.21861 type:complete len:187 (-) Transcript_21531:100-660(-)